MYFFRNLSLSLLLISTLIIGAINVQAAVLKGEYYWCNYFADNDTEFGEVTFDGNGTATSQGLQTSQGNLSNEQATYTIESDGSVSIDDNKGMVSSDGNFLFLVDTVGIAGVDIFVKKSTGLSNSILNGEYYVIDYFADNYTDFGEVNFDGVGGFTYVQLETSDGSPLNSGSGTYTVASDGQITMGNNRGMVSSDGKIAFTVDFSEIPGLVILVKKSTGLSNSILNIDYHSLNHFSNDFASFGEANFDGNGTITYQQLQSTSGSLDSGSGTYAVSSDGQITIDHNRGMVNTDGRFIFLVDLGSNPGIEIFAKKLAANSNSPDCSDIAGDWDGNWSETSCDNASYSGTWSGTVSSDCSFTGTDNWDTVSGTIDPSTLMLTATGISKDGCGTISVSGTFVSDSVSGGYTYSSGGNGTYSGNLLSDSSSNSNDNTNSSDNGGGGGGGGGCFIQALK
jgi:ribosomal protein L24E